MHELFMVVVVLVLMGVAYRFGEAIEHDRHLDDHSTIRSAGSPDE